VKLGIRIIQAFHVNSSTGEEVVEAPNLNADIAVFAPIR
jgi:hypothetical protein